MQLYKKDVCNQKIINSDNKSKTTWNMINQLSGKTGIRQELSLKDDEGAPIVDTQKIAATFNTYFTTKPQKFLPRYLTSISFTPPVTMPNLWFY